MVNVRVVGDRLSIAFFGMAGISGSSPESAEEIEAAINGYLAEPDVGLVLVTNSLAGRLGARFRHYLQRRTLPLVLSIPDRDDRQGAAEEIKVYLQRTLGIRL